MVNWKCTLCNSFKNSTKTKQRLGSGIVMNQVLQYLRDNEIPTNVLPSEFICSDCFTKVRHSAGLGKRSIRPPKPKTPGPKTSRKKTMVPSTVRVDSSVSIDSGTIQVVGVDDMNALRNEGTQELILDDIALLMADMHEPGPGVDLKRSDNQIEEPFRFQTLSELMMEPYEPGICPQEHRELEGNRIEETIQASYSQEAGPSSRMANTSVQGNVMDSQSTVDSFYTCTSGTGLESQSSFYSCFSQVEQMQAEPSGIVLDTVMDMGLDPVIDMGLNPDESLYGVSTTQSSHPSEMSSSNVLYSFPKPKKVILPFESMYASQTKCFICSKSVRTRTPQQAVMQLWLKRKIRVPPENRCCEEHLENKLLKPSVLESIQANKNESSMTETEISKMIVNLTYIATAKHQPINFDTLPDEKYDLLTGLSGTHFNRLMEFCKLGMKNSYKRSIANAIGMYLVRLRLGLSYRALAFLFGVEEYNINDAIISVRATLLSNFVPYYLGYEHTSKDELITNHSVKSYNALYDLEDDVLTLILDGTYIYIQKPTEFNAQWLLYSTQKKRHLIKMMMVITTSGYILDAAGPYGANGANNDASILKHMLSNHSGESEFLDFVEAEKTTLIVDRGFRDVEAPLVEKGFSVFKPNFLGKKQKQFTTTEANESRLVTMSRWKVEAINGKLKNKWGLFGITIPNNHLLTIGADFKIACALLNAYSPPLMRDNAKLARKIQLATSRISLHTNSLQHLVELHKLDRGKKNWKKFDRDSLEFPELTIADLEEITIGVFQTNMAKVYSSNHLSKDPKFEVELHTTLQNVLRCKVQSKYTRNKKHYAFIQFGLSKTGHEAIIDKYCKCQNGPREVGTCSHCTTLLYFFGYARHRVDAVPKKRDFCAGIINAAQRLQDPETSESEPDEDGD